jgi:hypothetical protein
MATVVEIACPDRFPSRPRIGADGAATGPGVPAHVPDRAPRAGRAFGAQRRNTAAAPPSTSIFRLAWRRRWVFASSFDWAKLPRLDILWASSEGRAIHIQSWISGSRGPVGAKGC